MSDIDTIRSAIWGYGKPQTFREDALAALSRVEQELAVGTQARRSVPLTEGGPGKEETYWLRSKLGAAVTHLRDIEDFYRQRGGLPESLNQTRADRARDIYEQISEDMLNGNSGVPPLLQRLRAAEQELADTREALEWYADRRNYAPAGGESAYDAVLARDGYDDRGPGARARAALAAVPQEGKP